MPASTERLQITRLKKWNLNIKTKFQDGQNVRERNTNNSQNDDINNGIILNKTYYQDHTPIHMEKEFNPSILYSLVLNQSLENEIECANCGRRGPGKSFMGGCPYCGSIYTIEYDDKSVGAMLHTNYVQKDHSYIKRTLIKDFIICLILSAFYCLSTGRTFTIFDLSKILGIATIGALLLFYPFYVLDSYMLSNKIKAEKEAQNKKQIKFWEDVSKYGISKSKFFNNLNNELNEFFYDGKNIKNSNVIDFDVIDYEQYSYEIDANQKLNIRVILEIRIVEMLDGAVHSKTRKYDITLVQNEIVEDEHHPGIYIAKCHGCGASIDIMKEQCDYCGAKIHFLQSWYITQIVEC